MTSSEPYYTFGNVTQQHGGLEIMYHRADSNWRGNLLCFAFFQQSLLALLLHNNEQEMLEGLCIR